MGPHLGRCEGRGWLDIWALELCGSIFTHMCGAGFWLTAGRSDGSACAVPACDSYMWTLSCLGFITVWCLDFKSTQEDRRGLLGSCLQSHMHLFYSTLLFEAETKVYPGWKEETAHPILDGNCIKFILEGRFPRLQKSSQPSLEIVCHVPLSLMVGALLGAVTWPTKICLLCAHFHRYIASSSELLLLIFCYFSFFCYFPGLWTTKQLSYSLLPTSIYIYSYSYSYLIHFFFYTKCMIPGTLPSGWISLCHVLKASHSQGFRAGAVPFSFYHISAQVIKNIRCLCCDSLSGACLFGVFFHKRYF